MLRYVILAAYVLASLPSGCGIIRPTADDDEPPWVLLLPFLLGPIVAPFRMLKVFLDLRDVRRLEALARQPA